MAGKVFVYGTLLVPAVLEAVTGCRCAAEPAVLEDYARYRLRNQVYPGIVARPGGIVHGKVYHGLNRRALSRLDRFESDLYQRHRVMVNCARRRIAAFVYVVAPGSRYLLSAMDWDPEEFERRHLASYLDGCRRT